jgi:hypothetical protein
MRGAGDRHAGPGRTALGAVSRQGDADFELKIIEVDRDGITRANRLYRIKQICEWKLLRLSAKNVAGCEIQTKYGCQKPILSHNRIGILERSLDPMP